MEQVVGLYRSPRIDEADCDTDRERFSIHGDRYRTGQTVFRDASLLLEEIRRYFSHHDPRIVTRRFDGEADLGTFTVGSTVHRVKMRSNGQAVAAFLQVPHEGNLLTMVMGFESMPPQFGQDAWWRNVIQPRVKAFLT